MVVAHWHKDGIEIYRLSGSRVERLAAGSLDRRKPIKAFGKKILIVGRDLLFHTRKRYPPASHGELVAAVQMEIEDLFPLKNPSHYSRVFQSTDTYALVDIWAWEYPDYKKLRSIFPFTHLLPEDVAFVSERPEMSIFGSKGITYAISHSENGFLGISSFKGDITQQQLNIFLKSLGRDSKEIKRINLYGHGIEADGGLSPQELKIEIVAKREKGYPICLDYIGKLNLKGFKVKTEERLSLKLDMALRATIYLFLAYSLSLYLTNSNYTSSIKEINTKIDRLSAEITAINAGQRGEDFSGVADALDKKLKGGVSPLQAMETLAKYLPDRSFITRIILNENNLELSLSSKEPLNVIRALGDTEGVKKVKLRGAPRKDASTGLYNFMLLVEM